MSWIEGTIEEFKGNDPRFRELRKIRTSASQQWNDLFFFRLSLARDAGYVDSELTAGRRIEFEPDPEADRPAVLRFKPIERRASPGTVRPVPTRTFLNPYHFIPLAAPAEGSLVDAAEALEGTLHDRYGGGGVPRFSGRVVCRLETEGPVVVGAEQRQLDGEPEQEREVLPFGLPDPQAPDKPFRRTPMIPGSTLRGMISSIVEAASCSTLRVLDNPSFKRRVFSPATRRSTTVPIPGTLHAAVARVSKHLIPLHAGRDKLTLAERLFGFVEQKGSERALAGRLRFSHALVHGEAPEGGWYEPAVTLKVLASPKPPSPALYFGNEGFLSKRDLNLDVHVPQGRKVYLHHPQRDLEQRCYETSDPTDKRNLKARVRPLRTGTSFLFHVDFENLTREELGYLLYALQPTLQFRHKLGMAKPLGLGRIRIDPLALCYIDRRACYEPVSICGAKYHSAESRQTREVWQKLTPLLADRYRHEAAALARQDQPTEEFPCWDHLVDEVRNGIPERVRRALEALGDPERVQVQVTYPVLLGQETEGEHFQWFVENDKGPRRALGGISTSGDLPALERYAPGRRERRNR